MMLGEESSRLVIRAIAQAYRELNTIRARDGVPYEYDGRRSSVDAEYFSRVVDDLDRAMHALTGRTAHCYPLGDETCQSENPPR